MKKLLCVLELIAIVMSHPYRWDWEYQKWKKKYFHDKQNKY